MEQTAANDDSGEMPTLLSVFREAYNIVEGISAVEVIELEELAPRERDRGHSWWEEASVYERMSAEEGDVAGRAATIFSELVQDFEALRDTAIATDLLTGRAVGSWSIKQIMTYVAKWSRKASTRCNRPIDREEAAMIVGLSATLMRYERLKKRFSTEARKQYRREVDRLKRLYVDAVEDVEFEDMTRRVRCRFTIAAVREGLAMQAAGELGWAPASEGTVRTLFHSLGKSRRSTRLVGLPALLPRKNWDYLLPYACNRGGVIYRGLMTGDRWVEIVHLSGASAGLSTWYGKEAVSDVGAVHASWAVEVDRPTLRNLPTGIVTSLAWWIEAGNPVTRRLYTELTQMAAAGARSRGYGTANAWRRARTRLIRVNPRIAWQVILPSATQGAVVAIHAGSRDYSEFRMGLCDRILAMLPDRGRILEEENVSLVASNNKGVVTWKVEVSGSGSAEKQATVETTLTLLAQRLGAIYRARGLYTPWDTMPDPEVRTATGRAADFVVSGAEWPDIEALRFLRLEEIAKEHNKPEGIG